MTEHSHESVGMFVNVTVSEHYQKLVWLTRCSQAGVVIQCCVTVWSGQVGPTTCFL